MNARVRRLTPAQRSVWWAAHQDSRVRMSDSTDVFELQTGVTTDCQMPYCLPMKEIAARWGWRVVRKLCSKKVDVWYDIVLPDSPKEAP